MIWIKCFVAEEALLEIGLVETLVASVDPDPLGEVKTEQDGNLIIPDPLEVTKQTADVKPFEELKLVRIAKPFENVTPFPTEKAFEEVDPFQTKRSLEEATPTKDWDLSQDEEEDESDTARRGEFYEKSGHQDCLISKSIFSLLTSF